MRGTCAAAVPLWSKAIEGICDKLGDSAHSECPILIVDRNAERVQLLKEILMELRVPVDSAVRVVDRFPKPESFAKRQQYDLIIRDAFLGTGEAATSLPQVGWRLAQPILTGRGKVVACIPYPSFEYTPQPNEIRPKRLDRQSLTHDMRECLVQIQRP